MNPLRRFCGWAHLDYTSAIWTLIIMIVLPILLFTGLLTTIMLGVGIIGTLGCVMAFIYILVCAIRGVRL